MPLYSCSLRMLLRGMADWQHNDLHVGRESRGRTGKLLSASCWAEPFRLRDCKELDNCMECFETYFQNNQVMPRPPRRALWQTGGVPLPSRQQVPQDILIDAFHRMRLVRVAVSVGQDRGQFSPEEFVCAGFVAAPFLTTCLPDPLAASIVRCVSSSVRQVVELLRGVCAAGQRLRLAALEHREAALHAGLNPNVGLVIKVKRVMLLAAMPRQISLPSHAVLAYPRAAGIPVADMFPHTWGLSDSPSGPGA